MAAIADALFFGLCAAVISAAVCLAFNVGPATLIAIITAALAMALAWRRPPTLAGVAAWLDRRHDLADLLGSAWAVRQRSETWATTLLALAAARVAALPPAGRVARFSGRHHACVAAGGLALLLAASLAAEPRPGPLPEVLAENTGNARAAVDARPDDRHIAAVTRRDEGMAASAAGLPSASDPTSGDTPRRPDGAQPDANGRGRADASQRSAVSIDSTATVATHRNNEAGGSGRRAEEAQSDKSTGSNTGVVAADGPTEAAKNAAGVADRDGGAKSTTPSASSTAAQPPAAYRELVRDFFAR